MSREAQFLTAIRSNGLRMTRQRKLILEVLEASQEHLDAEDIHDRVKAHDPRIGLATVYRTLALLKAMGLVKEHGLGEEHGHFEAVQEVPHYHFTCIGCRQVIEFEAPAVTEAVQSLIDREGAQVMDVHLSLTGYCSNCRKERATNHEAKVEV
ncbi:MAG: Fur family transcriptional regulator [Anaerolineales bacterium]|nr:Fur family transcriptional regulator [Anaerolineales bacterium]